MNGSFFLVGTVVVVVGVVGVCVGVDCVAEIGFFFFVKILVDDEAAALSSVFSFKLNEASCRLSPKTGLS